MHVDPIRRRLPALWGALLVLAAAVVWTPTRAHGAAAVAAAQRVVEATPPADRARLVYPFTDRARSDWHYTPRRRDGLPWREMSTDQRAATTALLRSALTDAGHDKLRALMALETTLRVLEGSSLVWRDPENYALALYGRPGDGGWGWRIEGHHLSLHFSLDGERYVGTLPQFLGANPALVPRGAVAGGPPEGFRLLGSEEDMARLWLASLNEAQRKQAVVSSRPYGNILSRNAARARPLAVEGLPFTEMREPQQTMLVALVAVFAEHLQPALAQARMERVRAAPSETVRMAWAGSTTPGEPFYFRIQSDRYLIEFDNSGGNHVHSVWRDFDGDFGRDVLREHYERAERAHGHGVR